MEKVGVKSEKVVSSCSSEVRSGIEALTMMLKTQNPTINLDNNQLIHPDDHDSTSLNIPTKPFLSLSHLVLQVLDKIGPTMAVMRQDVHQNIQRLEKICESDPLAYSNLVDVLKKETKEGVARKGPSSSKAIVWLTRSLDFTAALLQRIAKDRGQSMEAAVTEAYLVTLKPWHRWISSAAVRVALKLVPDKQTFISVVMGKDESYESLVEDIQSFTFLLLPFLEDIHSILRVYGLDRIKST